MMNECGPSSHAENEDRPSQRRLSLCAPSSSDHQHPMLASSSTRRRCYEEAEQIITREEEHGAAWGLVKMMSLREEPIWEIKKTLTASDVSPTQNRLLISKEVALEHVIRHLDRESRDEVHRAGGRGLRVPIRDADTGQVLNRVRIKLWGSTGCYVLVGGWSKDFIKRRELRKQDEIGLYWSRLCRMLVFSLLRRASDTPGPSTTRIRFTLSKSTAASSSV